MEKATEAQYYVRGPLVDAFQWTGSNELELPSWIKRYRIDPPRSVVVRPDAVIVIGDRWRLIPGEWFVRTSPGVYEVYSDKDFREGFVEKEEF